jgi:hypothetical protein
MFIPEKCLLIVKKHVWSQCTYVPKYEIVRGPVDYQAQKTGGTMQMDESFTLLRPGDSDVADDDEVAEDWTELQHMLVRITNRDGSAEIVILEEVEYQRSE